MTHDGTARAEGDIFTQYGAFPAYQSREGILDGRTAHDETGGKKGEVAQVAAKLAESRQELKDSLDDLVRENDLWRSDTHGHQRHGKNRNDFKERKYEHKEKQSIDPPAYLGRQNMQDTANIAEEQFFLNIHGRLVSI